MKNIILILGGLTFSLISYSQDKLWRIDKEVTKYYIDTLYSQLDLHYTNSSDTALVLWIELGNIDSLSNSQKIKYHFFTRKGDWSLMQMIWDGNVESVVPGLFDTFMKVVKPREDFTVSILKKGKISQDMLSSLEKHVVIVKAEDIKGLQIDNSIDKFNYKENDVMISDEWIK